MVCYLWAFRTYITLQVYVYTDDFVHSFDFISTHFSNKTLIIMPHQVCYLQANFQAFQTSPFEIEVYIWKSICVFFSILSAAERR